jgi:hypothetical protein
LSSGLHACKASTLSFEPNLQPILPLLRWGLTTICPGWPQTRILLISTYQVARIIGLSLWHPALGTFFHGRFCTSGTFFHGFLYLTETLCGEEKQSHHSVHENFFFQETGYSTGVWIHGLMLTRQALCHLSHVSSPFMKFLIPHLHK